MFELWRLVYPRRVKFIQWELVPSPLPPNTDDPNLRVFWSDLARNVDRARRRCIRASISPKSDTQRPLTMDDGTKLQVPSEDEAAPDLPHTRTSLIPPPAFEDLSSDTDVEDGCNQAMTNVQTPKIDLRGGSSNAGHWPRFPVSEGGSR